MESHPVPQNVTTFEFRLVGDMTLKQFSYLASGLGIAYITFVFFANAVPLLAWPLIIVSASIGAAFAFLPISERPLDHWMTAFFKATFRPTQLVYVSSKIDQSNPNFKDRLQVYLSSLNLEPVTKNNEQKISIKTLSQSPTPTVMQTIVPPASIPSGPAPQVTAPLPASIQPGPAQPEPTPAINPFNLPQTPEENPKEEKLPSSEELEKTVDLAKRAQDIQNKIIQTETELNEIKVQAANPGSNPKDFTKQFQEVLSELQQLNKSAGEISHELAITTKTSPAKHAKPSDSQMAPVKLPEKPKFVQAVTLTTVPNMINGIVTDATGDYLDGAIVVAHDKQGLPVRALKTNKLGQFLAATPMPNGTYTITIEKEDLSFDVIEVVLKGEVLKPIIISAKRSIEV